MAALIHRDDAVGIIAQRIISSDPTTNKIVLEVLAAMWLDKQEADKVSIQSAIDLYGWHVTREVALVALMHQIHEDAASAAGMSAIELDRGALGTLTAAVEMGADSFASLTANVGMCGLAVFGRDRYTKIRLQAKACAEGLSAMERDEFGFDHASLGAAMLWEADFPDSVCKLVLGHCAPTSPIWVAEQLAYQVDLGGGLKSNLPVPADILTRFGLTERRMEHLKSSMESAAGLPAMHFCGAWAA
jgi:hypothetical protein